MGCGAPECIAYKKLQVVPALKLGGSLSKGIAVWEGQVVGKLAWLSDEKAKNLHDSDVEYACTCAR